MASRPGNGIDPDDDEQPPVVDDGANAAYALVIAMLTAALTLGIIALILVVVLW